MAQLGKLELEIKLDKDIIDYIDEAIAKAIHENCSKLTDAINHRIEPTNEEKIVQLIEGEWKVYRDKFINEFITGFICPEDNKIYLLDDAYQKIKSMKKTI